MSVGSFRVHPFEYRGQAVPNGVDSAVRSGNIVFLPLEARGGLTGRCSRPTVLYSGRRIMKVFFTIFFPHARPILTPPEGRERSAATEQRSWPMAANAMNACSTILQSRHLVKRHCLPLFGLVDGHFILFLQPPFPSQRGLMRIRAWRRCSVFEPEEVRRRAHTNDGGNRRHCALLGDPALLAGYSSSTRSARCVYPYPWAPLHTLDRGATWYIPIKLLSSEFDDFAVFV